MRLRFSSFVWMLVPLLWIAPWPDLHAAMQEAPAPPEAPLAAPIRAVETALDARDFAAAEKQLVPLLDLVGKSGPPLEALSLLPLAERFESLARFDLAERTATRVLEVLEQTGGPTNPFLLPAIDKVVQIYKRQKRWSDAEPLLKRALAITEAAYREEGISDENPRVFSAIEALAELYMAAGRYPDAEAMYRRMITAMEKFYVKDAPMLDLVWTRLGDAARLQQRYTDAEAAYQRAIAASGKDNPFRDAALIGLAETFTAQSKYKEAEPLYQQAMAAQEEVLGPENPDLIGTLEKYAVLLRATNRTAEAAKLEARARKIKAATEGERP